MVLRSRDYVARSHLPMSLENAANLGEAFVKGGRVCSLDADEARRCVHHLVSRHQSVSLIGGGMDAKPRARTF